MFYYQHGNKPRQSFVSDYNKSFEYHCKFFVITQKNNKALKNNNLIQAKKFTVIFLSPANVAHMWNYS